MSAIAGVMITENGQLVREHGTRLMEALTRYPCDSSEVWQEGAVFLGCHNQWITPESVGERNPYFDRERNLVITSDAILDNRAELFERLQVSFSLRKQISDNELILLAYDKWEEDAPRFLVGDFAFMLWDQKKEKLFGARDFSGGRTLYYHYNEDCFAFCTTIMPLFTLPNARRELNEEWLAEFLAIAGMVDVADVSQSVYKNMEQLPPAHAISVTRGQLSLRRYCQLDVEEKLRFKSDEQYVEAFQEVFQEAVTSRLRTHRQVGAQLSGGLDSGAIVSYAAQTLRQQNRGLHTFSYVPASDFVDYTPKFQMPDERPLIQSTVQHVGGLTAHYLDFKGRDSYSEIDSFLATMEMPYKFFENSFWMEGMFEKAHEQGAGILLNGGRGNLSISWGSAIPYYATLLKQLRWLKLLREMKQYSYNIGSGRKRVLASVSRAAFPIIDRLRPIGEPYHYPMIISPEFARKTDVFGRLASRGIGSEGWFSAKDPYAERKSHFQEIFHWNAGNTLSTKLSLKYRLWKRDPSNDWRVIRFCLSLPEDQYVQNGTDRALIRRATASLLPDEVRLNQRIRGVQGADWVHRMLPHWPAFTAELEEMRSDRMFQEFVNGKVVDEAMASLTTDVQPRHAIDPHFRLLMRSVIVYRFLKKHL